MLTCARCGDLNAPTAIHCAGCGAALLAFAEMCVALTKPRKPAAKHPLPTPEVAAPYWSRCPWCGSRCRGASCRGCSDLDALAADVGVAVLA